MPMRASFSCTAGVANDSEGSVAPANARAPLGAALPRRSAMPDLRVLERGSLLAILFSGSAAAPATGNGSSRVRFDPERWPLPPHTWVAWRAGSAGATG